MPRKPRTTFTKKLKDFICEKLTEGFTVAEICDRKYKDETPDSKSVYRHARNNEEFRNQLNESYELFFMRKIEEIEYVSSTDSLTLYPHLSDARERFEARRTRLDTLKFLVGKMAPMFSERFTTTAKIEHKGELKGPNIVIQSYATEIATKKEDK